MPTRRRIVWNADQVDLDDPFQRRWRLKQASTHGLADDIRQLDLDEVERELDALDLPPVIYALWKSFFESRDGER